MPSAPDLTGRAGEETPSSAAMPKRLSVSISRSRMQLREIYLTEPEQTTQAWFVPIEQHEGARPFPSN